MSDFRLSRADIVKLNASIQGLLSLEDRYNTEFTYFLSKNKRLLKTEVESIKETLTTVLTAYRTACIAVKEDCIRLDQLKKVHDKEIKEAETFMNAHVIIDLQKISIKNVPSIPSDLFDGLYPIIEE